jgi:hypothetical protein
MSGREREMQKPARDVPLPLRVLAPSSHVFYMFAPLASCSFFQLTNNHHLATLTTTFHVKGLPITFERISYGQARGNALVDRALRHVRCIPLSPTVTLAMCANRAQGGGSSRAICRSIFPNLHSRTERLLIRLYFAVSSATIV